MAIKYVVDTHALLWYLEGNPKLGAAAKAVLSDPASELVVPSLVLAEAVFTVEKGKVKIPSVADLIADVTADARMEIYRLDFDILRESLTLTAIPEMHDRLIVATGLYLQNLGAAVRILTKDNEITVSRLLPVIWR